MIKDHRHGVVAYDCDHPACKTAVMRCRKAYELRLLDGTSPFVDAAPVRLHIATLQGRGWSLRAIAGEARVGAGMVSNIARQVQTRTRPAVAQRILAVRPDAIPVRPSTQTTEPFVPRVGVVRRIQALMTLGWTHDAMTGLSGKNTRMLLHQHGSWVTRTTYDAIDALYHETCTKAGPSERTRQRAAKLGYVSPMGWDDIDRDEAPEVEQVDPDAPAHEDLLDEVMVQRIVDGQPKPRHATNAEATEAYRRLRAAGVSTSEIENRIGLRSSRYIDRSNVA